MKEIPAWRRKSFHASLALVLINPVFFAVTLPLADHLRLSNKVWGRLIAIGVFGGAPFACIWIVRQGPPALGSNFGFMRRNRCLVLHGGRLMIAVIDYKAGNLTSVVKALHYLGEGRARCCRHAVARCRAQRG